MMRTVLRPASSRGAKPKNFLSLYQDEQRDRSTRKSKHVLQLALGRLRLQRNSVARNPMSLKSDQGKDAFLRVSFPPDLQRESTLSGHLVRAPGGLGQAHTKSPRPLALTRAREKRRV